MLELEVYDDFALVVFENQSVFLAFRPDVEGELALYNTAIVDPGDTRQGYLLFQDAPLQYYAVVADRSLSYSYIMNILTEDSQGK